MEILSLEEWINADKPRSYLHSQIRVKFNCKECQKEKITGPSDLKRRNLERLFCSLGCSTRYRNLHDGVPAQKEGWKEKWTATSLKNGTLPIKEKNPRWIEDRELVNYVRINRIKYHSILRLAIQGEYGENGFLIKHGYTVEQLKNHIEKQFKEGLCWNNYGEWEIDHIKSVGKYLYSGIEDFKIINSLKNLRPLWKSENRKRNRETNHDLQTLYHSRRQ